MKVQDVIKGAQNRWLEFQLLITFGLIITCQIRQIVLSGISGGIVLSACDLYFLQSFWCGAEMNHATKARYKTCEKFPFKTYNSKPNSKPNSKSHSKRFERRNTQGGEFQVENLGPPTTDPNSKRVDNEAGGLQKTPLQVINLDRLDSLRSKYRDQGYKPIVLPQAKPKAKFQGMSLDRLDSLQTTLGPGA